jgi:hypothetical protein
VVATEENERRWRMEGRGTEFGAKVFRWELQIVQECVGGKIEAATRGVVLAQVDLMQR